MQLQGTREWDRLWESLVEFAERFGLTGVEFDLSVPSLQEEFFASWERPTRQKESARLYRADIPLSASFGPIGSLRIAGYNPNESACQWIAELIEGLRAFETQIADLIAADLVAEVASVAVAGETVCRVPRPMSAAVAEPVESGGPHHRRGVARRHVAGAAAGR